MPRYEIMVAPTAVRALQQLETVFQRRIATAIERLTEDPRPPTAKRLAGTADLWRIRVGAYRVIYTIEDDKFLILVLKLGPRRSIYRGM